MNDTTMTEFLRDRCIQMALNLSGQAPNGAPTAESVLQAARSFEAYIMQKDTPEPVAKAA